ncbi:MAG TPA: AMP-binding protein, partial [Vicinamibacterales bacterium]|nr:AMP-binding protein [Vicinamibacterales bacterium]
AVVVQLSGHRRSRPRLCGHAARPGITRGQHVVIWGENRPEWVIALWGCLLRGVVLVPIDYRASAAFLEKVADIVDARAILVGDTVPGLPDPALPLPDAGAPPSGRPVWMLPDLGLPRAHKAPSPVEITPDDVAEVIFTSGATSEPKGVVLTHRNILANVVPIEREVAKYRRYATPFLPIRFLNLLPLSHMFGQAMATFVPPLLEGEVLFTRTFAPDEIIGQIRSHRVSVLVCVPKILEVLRDHLLRVQPEVARAPAGRSHWLRRWWRYRRAHRAFGWKFWAMVVGAAPLDPDVEAFWGQLGFLVVQGYGLTETAPIVSLNHPFHATRGAVGRPMPGVEVRIAEDGEILVRGENVTRGYFKAPEETRAAFRDGWFHTGDIGSVDEQGRLHIRGRKKEMIVTPEGLNVFPEDVERVLNEQPGVRESAVVGAPVVGGSAERVHAIVVLEPQGDLQEIVRRANAALQDHQKLRAATPWPAEELPRTEGTRKLKRRELRDWLIRYQDAEAGGRRDVEPALPRSGEERSVTAVLQRFAPGRPLTPETTIDELGLSSLERVELMMALEETLQVTVDEAAFASAASVTDLEALARPVDVTARASSVAARPGPTVEPIEFPSWNRSAPARGLRRLSLPTWILPAARVFASLDVQGLDHLRDLQGPVIFAANHQSHMDTPVLLMALPPRWRYRVAPAMAKEFFRPHFHPEQFSRKAYLTNSLNYYLACLFFNAFPLPQREAGTRQTLRYIGELVTDGYSVLIFPEGRRTQEGEIAPFQPGVGMIASRLKVPVVPVRLEGVERILHQTWKFARRGRARVAFGEPLRLSGGDYQALARQVEHAVRSLQ